MKQLKLLLLLSLGSLCLHAQTLILGAADNGNFENGATGWTIVNGNQTNKWVVSNGATPGFGGNGCMYISSSPAAPFAHAYNTSATNFSYFYRDVPVPAGTQKLWLVFDYICNGEWVTDPFYGTVGIDGFRIYGRNTSTTITAGQDLPGSFTITNQYVKQGSWRRKEVRYLDATTFAGSTMRLIFQWENNNGNGTQPPAAIDNIEIYAGCQAMFSPSFDNLTGNSVRLSWGTVGGASGYEIRYRKHSEPVTVSTYTNPVAVNGSSTYYATITGLASGTDYVAEIRPTGTGSGCTEYSAPLSFTTLPTPPNDSCSGAIALPVENNACAGTAFTFIGATPSATPGGNCLSAANNDVWFSFVATGPKQLIQTSSSVIGNEAEGIELYTGNCGSLQAVNLPCPTLTGSPALQTAVWRLEATGLATGTTYYVRVKTNSNTTTADFRICVYNPPPMPACPVQLSPADGILNVSTASPTVFRWRAAANAKAYRLRISETNGAYADVITTDTTQSRTLSENKTYFWNVSPYNIADELAACSTSFSLTTCPAIANSVTLSAATTQKCTGDSIKIKASSAPVGLQWYLDGQIIAGATADSLWANASGSYTVRIANSGGCTSLPSNAITITNLATPVKPSLSVSGNTSFCAGGSATLTPSFNLNNQWFNGGSIINGATGNNYTATQSGSFYVRLTNSSSGCSSYSDTVTIKVNPTPATPSITPQNDTAICAGDSLRLRASAASNNQWYKSGASITGATGEFLTVKTAGSYTVKNFQNDCPSASSSAVVIVVSALPAVPTITGNGSLLTAPPGYAAYQWYLNGVAIAGATTNSYTTTQNGLYKVQVSNVNGCMASSPEFNQLTSALNEVVWQGLTVKIYPNPVADALTVQVSGTSAVRNVSAEVLDLQGKRLQSQQLKAGANRLLFAGLPQGIYQVVLKTTEGQKTVRIVKAH